MQLIRRGGWTSEGKEVGVRRGGGGGSERNAKVLVFSEIVLLYYESP